MPIGTPWDRRFASCYAASVSIQSSVTGVRGCPCVAGGPREMTQRWNGLQRSLPRGTHGKAEAIVPVRRMHVRNDTVLPSWNFDSSAWKASALSSDRRAVMHRESRDTPMKSIRWVGTRILLSKLSVNPSAVKWDISLWA